MFTAVCEYEAFAPEYEEQQEVLRDLAEEQAIEAAWADYRAEKAKRQPKYARAARKHVPTLRKIFWNGTRKKEAQEILRLLMLEQTGPLSSLDHDFTEVEEDKGVVYTEADPYTGEPLDDDGYETQDQLERDYIEVQREIEWMNKHPEALRLDEDMYDMYRGMHKIADEPAIKIPPVEAIIVTPETEMSRLVEETRKLVGDDEELIAQVIEANSQHISFYAEDIQYEDGVIPSVPLTQNEEQELKTTKELSDLRNEARPYIQALRDLVRFQSDHWKAVQQSFVDFLKEIQSDKRYNEYKALEERITMEGLWSNPMVSDFIWEVKDRGRTFSGMAWYTLQRMTQRPPHDGVLSCPWGDSMWLSRVHQDVMESRERREFLAFMKRVHDEYEPQDLLAVFLGVQNSVMLEESDADLIPCPGYSSLGHFIEVWGDAILDEVRDEAIPNYGEMSDEDIIKLADKWEEEIIDTQFTDDGEAWNRLAKTLGAEKKCEIYGTKAFARGVFNALSSGEDDLVEAGMRQWRHERSPLGAIAYDHAMKVETGPDAMKKAWRAFWNAGKVIGLNPSGLRVRCETTGKEELVNWGLAKWKISRKEIFLTSEEKVRLKKILEEKGWGRALAAAL